MLSPQKPTKSFVRKQSESDAAFTENIKINQ